MTQGIGANLTNDEKRSHLADLKREHLIDQQEISPPEGALEYRPNAVAFPHLKWHPAITHPI
jgi:hypothetical protein